MGGSTSSGSSQSQGYGSSYNQSASLSLPENLQNAAFQDLAPSTAAQLSSLSGLLGGGPGGNSILQQFLAPYGGQFSAPVTAAQDATLANIGSAENGNYSFNPELGGILQQLSGEATNPVGFAQQVAAGTPITSGEQAIMAPGYAASLATGQPTQSIIQAALQPIEAQFNTQTAPGLSGSFAQAGQRASGMGSSAFGGAYANAEAQELATEAATSGNIENATYQEGLTANQNANQYVTGLENANYGTGLNMAAAAPGQYSSLSAQEAQNLISTLNAQALPQMTEQLGINNALSTYNGQINSLMQALGLQVQAEQPVIGYESESASNSASFQNEESSGQNSSFSFQI